MKTEAECKMLRMKRVNFTFKHQTKETSNNLELLGYYLFNN